MTNGMRWKEKYYQDRTQQLCKFCNLLVMRLGRQIQRNYQNDWAYECPHCIFGVSRLDPSKMTTLDNIPPN